MKRERIIILLFWIFYMPTSLIIWFLTGEQLIEFIAIASIGIGITANYLFLEHLIYLTKKKKKKPVDQFIGFRNLFSNKPLEVIK